MRSEYVVSLRGMLFHTRVGILPHERELPQPLEVDVSVWVPAPGGGAMPSVDYRSLYDITAATVRERPIELLEHLVTNVAHRVRDESGGGRVRVTARKPHVALPGPLAYAEVTLDLEPDA